ncbi:MAG: chaperone modulator CbpM [Betaproteobacteria bacterium]|nr:chaperone modulator CbpM [Betaproteobacteria bacterium]
MSDDVLLTLEELVLVCSVTPEWVRERVEEGLLPTAPEWRFSTIAVRRVRRMVALERDFDAAPELAALMADLLEELDALRARVR